MSPCPIHGCKRTKADKYLMCGIHWREVPQDFATAVWRTWYAMERHPERTADYRAARLAAIGHVEKAEAAAA